MKKFLEKIQKLPENERKIILWAVVVVIGLSFFVWYFKSIKLVPVDKEQLESDLKIDDLKDDLNQLPGIEIPNL
jgi:hypothetical protein